MIYPAVRYGWPVALMRVVTNIRNMAIILGLFLSVCCFSVGVFTALDGSHGLPCHHGDWGRRPIRLPSWSILKRPEVSLIGRFELSGR